MSGPVTREEEGSVKVARPEGVPIADVGVALGATVEVLWDVELDDGSSDSVWWAAKVGEPTEEEAGAARLVYVADHGFEEETRRVLFLDDNHLWDTGLKEPLPYRREGEKGPDLEPAGENEEGAAEGEEGEEEADDDGGDGGAFRVGTTVKARFQGGRYCAGTIAAANADGTYDVLYEDHVLEQSVPGDCIETVSLAPSVRAALADGGTVAAESVSDFFEIFVNSLTSGPAFARLTPDQKRIASEKVQAMRPHFDAELKELRDQRGWGALVTGEDIKELLPRVAARQAMAARQVSCEL